MFSCSQLDSELCLQAAAESEMLTEMQWRVAALEALHAFVLGPCTRCGPLQAATLTATCASLLQPTLDAVCAAPALQVLMTECSKCQGSCGIRNLSELVLHIWLSCRREQHASWSSMQVQSAAACWSPGTTWEHSMANVFLIWVPCAAEDSGKYARRSRGCLPVQLKMAQKLSVLGFLITACHFCRIPGGLAVAQTAPLQELLRCCS